MEINPNTRLEEILRKYPASIEVFKRYRMNCASCTGIAAETVRTGCANHGLDMQAFIKDLQEIAGQ